MFYQYQTTSYFCLTNLQSNAIFRFSLIDESFCLSFQLRYKVDASGYCIELMFGAMLDMSVTHRLNIGPSTEPRGTPYLDVRKDEQFEFICTKSCLCV